MISNALKTRLNSASALGRVYDLQSLFDRLNRLYFDNQLCLQIQWSKRKVSKASRRVILGSYCDRKKTITLSRRLDRPDVPLFYVEHILFHEMLHAVFPREKHLMHTDKFKRYERMHPDYARALAWEKNSKGLLFRSAQSALSFLKKN